MSNKLGAFALAVNDATEASVQGTTPSVVAALITFANRSPLSIGEIAEVVGLTHSAAVRLVDRLEEGGFVRRQRRVGREVLVDTTARGRRRAAQFSDARERAVETFLAALDPDERVQLSTMIDKMIARQIKAGLNVHKLARMCRSGSLDVGLGEDDAGEGDGDRQQHRTAAA